MFGRFFVLREVGLISFEIFVEGGAGFLFDSILCPK